MWKCKYCQNKFENLSNSQKANHTKWCESNPKKKMYLQSLNCARLCKKQNENQFTKAKKLGINVPQHSSKGKSIAGTPHTEQTKIILREKALNSNHRRILKSTRKYICKDGSEVLLDSSWEEILAKRLDELNISWIRPKPVKWYDDSGKKHNYFPDFYLTEHNIYLDPKNEQVYKMTLEKIEKITKVLPNLIILRSLEECKNFKI